MKNSNVNTQKDKLIRTFLVAGYVLFCANFIFAEPGSPSTYGGYWSVSSLKDFIFIVLIGKIIAPATVIVVSIIMLMFFYNSAKYIFKSDSAQERNKTMMALAWGVAIIFLMVSIWGVVKIVAYTLNLEIN